MLGENYMKDEKNILAIRMLGGLSITYGGKPLVLAKNVTSKMVHLFLMLLYTRESGIRREELIETLYEDCDMEQASNSFRGMVFRLRKNLIAAGLPEGEYITNKVGIYRWESGDVKIWLDVEEFTRLVEEGLKETDQVVQQKLLEDADELYRGEFLPAMIADEWVAVSNRKFQDLYFRCMRRLLELLKQEESNGKLMHCCDKMTELYPFEEWQLAKLDCLIKAKEYKEALSYYDEVVNLYQEEFGLLPSQELKKRLQSIREHINYDIRSINEIQERFMEEEEPGGATYCDLTVFTVVYRYMIKVLDRTGMSAYLMLYTLTDKNRMPIEKADVLEDVREAMFQSVKKSVRRSDLYTRYGKNQFLILLVGSNQKGCERVAARIKRNFNEVNTRKRVDICYTLSSIMDVKPDLIKKQFDKSSLDWR